MKHAKPQKKNTWIVVIGVVLVVLAVGIFLALAHTIKIPQLNTQAGFEEQASNVSSDSTAQSSVEPEAQPSVEPEVHYIGIIGADTWHESDGSFHLEGSDLQMVMRVDVTNGVISLLTIPRDTYYDNTHGGVVDPTVVCTCKTASFKSNYAFHYGFYEVWNGSNYDEAARNGAEACVDMMSNTLGITVDDYALVDLNTFQELVDSFGGIEVNIPLPIDNYSFYSGEPDESIGYGLQALDGWMAMVASRAREPYGTVGYSAAWSDAWDMLSLDGITVPQDPVRQSVDRRMFVSLMSIGLAVGDSDVLDSLVERGCIKTTLSATSIDALYNAVIAKRGHISVHAASVRAVDGAIYDMNGDGQWLIPYDADAWAAIVKQFTNGESMTTGYAYEDTTL